MVPYHYAGEDKMIAGEMGGEILYEVERFKRGVLPHSQRGLRPVPVIPRLHEIVVRNDLCYARGDKFPVSKGHLLDHPVLVHAGSLFDD